MEHGKHAEQSLYMMASLRSGPPLGYGWGQERYRKLFQRVPKNWTGRSQVSSLKGGGGRARGGDIQETSNDYFTLRLSVSFV